MKRTQRLFRFLRGSTYAGSMALVLTPETASASEVNSAVKAQLQDAYGNLPLSFEGNRGQTDSRVRFQSRGLGYALFLTPTDAVLALRKATLRLQLLGANPHPKMHGLEQLHGTVNYFIGKDPQRWRTSIPTHSKVKYDGVYPGVDVVYYGNQQQLEFDFIVAPGADPSAIRMVVEGPDRAEVDGHGDLVLRFGGGEVRLAKPFAYQTANGARQPVSVGYVLQGSHQVGFQVAAYDGSRSLVIDPTLDYSTYLGGTSDELSVGNAVDVAGNAYVAGITVSTDFPTTAGAFDTAPNGIDDVFVTKLDPTGTALVYSTYLGGIGIDQGLGMTVDLAGSAYVTGRANSTDFPTTAGAFDTTLDGEEAFVAKLNGAGSGLVYSTYLGGSDGDRGFDIAVDVTGNAYVTGVTRSTDFPTTAGAFDATFNGATFDAFVTKLNPAGTGLVYSTYLGGTGDDDGRGIVVDVAGNAHVGGLTFSTDFPTTAGAFDTTLGGTEDAFVTKLNPTGSGLSYSTYLGGTAVDAGFAIALDVAGNAYVTGETNSTDFPTTPGAFQTTLGAASQDAFVTKLNLTGAVPVYSTYLGGTAADQGFGIAVDVTGNAYVIGRTFSFDFPTTAGALQTVLGGSSDAFVTKVNPTGVGLFHSSYLGGSSADRGDDIALDLAGNAYLTGFTQSTNFPTTAGAFDTTFNGVRDGFVARISDVLPDRIAFASTRDGNSEIYVMNVDGTGQTRLTTDPAGDASPSWSPDRTKITFASTRDGNSEIYVMNADGTGQTRLTNNGASDALPSWSPDGAKIAFASTRDGNSEIYVMNADGTGQTRLTNNGAEDTWPAWSPDGTQIAFTTNRHGGLNYEIYAMNANGTSQTRLTNNPAVDVDPDWSPDGTRITFSTNRHGFANVEIYVMDTSGTGQTRLTTNAAVDGEPAWSPDGTKIVFSTNRDGGLNFEIYVMNADGTIPTRLTTQPQLDISPAW